MKNVLYAAGAIALLTLSGLFALIGVEVDHARLLIETNVAAVRHDVDVTIHGDPADGNSLYMMMPLRERLIAEVDQQLSNTRADAKEIVGDLRKDTFAQLTSIQANALTAIATATAPLSQAAGTVEQLRADLKPSIDHAASITAHADEASAILFRRDALPSQILGVLGGAKVALGETATTMRDVQRATPGFIATWQQIGDHVSLMTDAGAKASQATQHTMENFAAASKPLPTWARIALGVGPPVAQAGAAAASAGQALHWIK